MAVKSIGSFEVLGTLGEGAHSKILHVRCDADAIPYALKIVPIENVEDRKFLVQAEHEYRIAQKLDHRNLIKIHALEKRRNWVFRVREVRLLIEYVNGRTLDTFKIIPLPKLAQIFLQIASGLVQMHRRNICHGDLKPNNIMLSRSGEVKIIDYGLAWVKGDEKGRIQGTPEYMAPEQFKKRMVNEQTDIFNFGATMYRLTTWRNIPPVMTGVEGAATSLGGKSWEASLVPVHELNANVPPLLANLIQRCLAYHPNQRPEQVSEIQGELEHVVHQLGESPEDAV